ncbi:MAG: hypothetical protein FJX46_13735, partial [Alphaproteobacteria bacterium]|nr:hypothetical protein [Alphaproteobacteria bacterium]
MKRRKFLTAAGAGLAGAAAAPAAARAQAARTIRWKLQTANPTGTPHHVLLTKFSANVDKMSGGRLKIEILPAGAIV